MVKGIVRPACAADVAAIFAIRTGVKENHLSQEQLTERGITPARILEMLALPTCIWVADVNDTPVGFTLIDSDEGSVFALFVRPEYEGLGLGKQLMDQAEAVLFQYHAVLWLETDSHSRAAGFYQHRGWYPVAQCAGNDRRYQKKRP